MPTKKLSRAELSRLRYCLEQVNRVSNLLSNEFNAPGSQQLKEILNDVAPRVISAKIVLLRSIELSEEFSLMA